MLNQKHPFWGYQLYLCPKRKNEKLMITFLPLLPKLTPNQKQNIVPFLGLEFFTHFLSGKFEGNKLAEQKKKEKSKAKTART